MGQGKEWQWQWAWPHWHMSNVMERQWHRPQVQGAKGMAQGQGQARQRLRYSDRLLGSRGIEIKGKKWTMGIWVTGVKGYRV